MQVLLEVVEVEPALQELPRTDLLQELNRNAQNVITLQVGGPVTVRATDLHERSERNVIVQNVGQENV